MSDAPIIYERCTDCEMPTMYRDPRHDVPCCATCLRELYGDPEYLDIVRAQNDRSVR